MWESAAIAGYLVRTYGKNDSLYPKDPQKKALVDQRLQFNVGTLYPKIRAICVSAEKIIFITNKILIKLQFPVLYLGEIEIPDELKAPLDEVLGFLDVFLEGNDFVTGNTITIADYALAASVSSIAVSKFELFYYKSDVNTF